MDLHSKKCSSPSEKWGFFSSSMLSCSSAEWIKVLTFLPKWNVKVKFVFLNLRILLSSFLLKEYMSICENERWCGAYCMTSFLNACNEKCILSSCNKNIFCRYFWWSCMLQCSFRRIKQHLIIGFFFWKGLPNFHKHAKSCPTGSPSGTLKPYLPEPQPSECPDHSLCHE